MGKLVGGRPTAWLVVVMVALAAATLSAQDVVIYRCTDSSGALSFQNDVPCPKGSRQEKRVVQPAQVVPTPAPVATAARVAAAATVAAPPAPDNADPEPPVADADRLPPPPLYQCNTWDDDSYLSDSGEAAPRCVRVETTGIGGDSRTAAGEACRMVTDQCQRVPDAAACGSWRQRLKEVEASWRFARAADKDAQQQEFVRVTDILRRSTCGAGG